MQKEFLKDTLSLVAGSALFGLGLCIFAVPNSLVTGGAGGLAIILSSITGLPVGMGILLINIPLFIFAYILCGTRYAVRNLFSTFVFSALVDIVQALVPYRYTKNIFISALCCGILSAFAIYILLRRALVTGGSDLLAYLINKKNPKRAVGTLIFLIDSGVVIAGAFLYKSVSKTVYSVFLIGVMSIILTLLMEKKINGKLFKRNHRS